MKKNLLIIIFIGIGILIGVYQMAAAQSSIDETSALSGTVSWTAQPGDAVNEGSDLVRISTMTGSVAACRASSGGTVKEILVHPGENIKSGQVVARLAAQ